MIKFNKYSIIFSIGCFSYAMIELIWRGYSHWTMALLGGGCFAFAYFFNLRFYNMNIFKKAFFIALTILIMEFLVGCIVNIILKWNVWDYSKLKFNILGQVCPIFFFLWFLLSIAIIFICNNLEKLFAKFKFI